MTAQEEPGLEDKCVCDDCVGDAYLKQMIRDNGDSGICFYCQEQGPAVTIGVLADTIDRAFEEHYFQTSTEPEGMEYAMLRDPDIDYEWEREGEEALWVITEAAEIDETIAEDIRQILEERHDDFDQAAMGVECPFSEDSHYARKSVDDGEFPYLWKRFESDLKTKSRFFSRSAKATLDQIFRGIHGVTATDGRQAVVDAGPGTSIDHLFRTRVFPKDAEKLNEALAYPWKHLGTPPAEFARAGRMNASGIAVFYGARDQKTAIAEVRPPVGSKVLVAQFNLLRTVRLLDPSALTSINAEGSIFDPSTILTMQRACFLEALSCTMSRAIMPHEEESEYLPTQAIAEYLATECSLDGMIFPSVQAGTGAANVVLFHHAARIQEVQLPRGTEVSADLDVGNPDDPMPEYTVFERLPTEPAKSDKPDSRIPPLSDLLDPFEDDYHSSYDNRQNTLQVALDSIEVHLIGSVRFQSQSFPISRVRLPRD